MNSSAPQVGPLSTGYPARRLARAATVAVVTVLGTLTVPLVVAPDAQAAASLVYVASTGSNTSNTCAVPATPCATVTYALTQAAVGATIQVTGTINDHVTVAKSVRITGVNAPAASPAVLDGTNSGSVFTVTAADVTLDHLTIQHGKNGTGNGGGILDTSGPRLTLTNVTVANNTAAQAGGALYDSSSALTVTNSTFVGNSASIRGAGILISTGGTASIATSTISGNNGTGITAYGGTVTLTSSTVGSNLGPGIATQSPSLFHVGATILAGNKGGNCEPHSGSLPISVGYNLDGDGNCGFSQTGDVTTANPGLGALTSPGTTIQTMPLSTTSPGADAIPTVTTLNSIQVCPRTDQLGQAAPLSGQGGCAIGAVEPTSSSVTPIDTMYVSSTGSNTSNTCTNPAAPCATVTYALSKISPFTPALTINLSGTVHDNVGISTTVPITITGAGASSPAVLDGSSSGHVINMAVEGVLHLDHLTVQHGHSQTGGGIDNAFGTVTLDHVTVTANTADTNGGGVDATGGTTTISYSTISYNAADACKCSIGGGGIGYADGAAVTVLNSTIAGNTAGESGGGIASLGLPPGPLIITSSTLSGNHAGYEGGGLDIALGTVKITNSTIANNTSDNNGGGLSVAQATLYIIGSTIANNSAANGFGAIQVVSSVASAPMNVGATIVEDNTPWNCSENDGSAHEHRILSYDFNIDTDLTCGVTRGGLPATTADLGPLTDNGGPTQTMMPSATGAAAFALTAGTIMNFQSRCPRTDQRGVAGPTGAHTACSSGAVEVTDAAPAPAFTSPAAHTVAWGDRFNFSVTTSGARATFAATTALPTGVTFTDNGNGTGTVAGSVFAPGTYSFTLQATNGVLPNATQTFAITASKRAQLPLAISSLTGTYGVSLPLTTSGGSGTGAVTYTVANGTATGCTVAGSALTVTNAGTCIVTATKAADANYNAQPSAATTVTFGKANQAVLTVTSTSGTFGTALTLTTSGGSGTGAVTYTVVNGTATGCTITAGALSSTSAGTCTVTATKAADTNYTARSSAATTITFGKATQATLIVTSVTGTYGAALTLTTSGGSGTGAVTYTTVNGTATGCTITAGALSSTSAGTCTVTATKAADGNYSAKSSAATTVTFGKATQATLTVTSTTGTFGAALTLTTSGGSGTGAVSYTATNGTATGCTVTGSTLTTTSTGTCTVTATKAGDANYNARSSAATTVTFGKATQAALTVTSTSGAFGTPLTLTASGGSGTGAVSFVAVNGTASGCTITTGALSTTSAGTCTVTATRAGDANFNPRSSAATTVTFARATQAVLTVTSVAGTYGGSLPLTTSGGSGTGAVTYTVVNGSATGCTVAGSTLSTTSAGTCTVTATKAADTNYNAESSAATTVTFAKATQAVLTVTSLDGVFGTPLTLTTSGGSGTGAVTYTAADGTAIGCTVAGSTLTTASTGTCTVTATKAADTNYTEGTSDPTTVTFAANPSTTAIAVTSTQAHYGTEQSETFHVTVTSTAGTPTGSVTVTAGATTLCTAVLTAGTGSCFPAPTALPPGSYGVIATYAGDATYAGSSTPSVPFTVTKGTTKTTLALSSAKDTYGSEQRTKFTVKVSSGSLKPTGHVTIKAGSTTLCTVTLSAGTGSCSPSAKALKPGKHTALVASYGGSTLFATSKSSAHTLTVAKAPTKTVLTLSKTTVTAGHEQAEKLTVKVTSAIHLTPTGTVTITSGHTTLCKLTLKRGTRSCTLKASALAVGKHTLHANYRGNPLLATSTSPGKTVTVKKA